MEQNHTVCPLSTEFAWQLILEAKMIGTNICFQKDPSSWVKLVTISLISSREEIPWEKGFCANWLNIFLSSAAILSLGEKKKQKPANENINK